MHRHRLAGMGYGGTLALAIAALLYPLATGAQGYPDKPVKIVVPYAAGGAVDIISRTVGQALAEQLKQPVLVDNRPGASANIGMEASRQGRPLTDIRC